MDELTILLLVTWCTGLLSGWFLRASLYPVVSSVAAPLPALKLSSWVSYGQYRVADSCRIGHVRLD